MTETPSDPIAESRVERVAAAIYQSHVTQVIAAISKRSFDFGRAYKFFESCTLETDRALPVLIFSFVDETIKALLTDELNPETPGGRKELLGPLGPLGTASARIRILAALFWLSPETAHNLDALRKIRNRFAHDPFLPAFDDPAIKALIDKLAHCEEPALSLPQYAFIDITKIPYRVRYMMRAGGVYARMVTQLICAPTTIRMGLRPGEILGGEFDAGPEIKRDALRWCAKVILKLAHDAVLGAMPEIIRDPNAAKT